MVKPILQIYPVIPAADEEERAALRPLGRNSQRYHQVVHGMTDVIRAADDLGFWGVSTVEHHFHSEGYEVGPSPGTLNAYWASATRRARVGALGYTMSAQNPFRVAEETAIIDHLTSGRSFVGFSRGYQSRWTNVLGQHLGVRATLSPSGMEADRLAAMTAAELSQEREIDRINREAFEENVDLVIKAWTLDGFDHKSDRWEVPFPHDEGIAWKMREATERLGAPGEIGPDGRLHKVAVVPAPYQRPHPPVFVASAASQETVEYCGRRGFIPAYFSGASRAASHGRLYTERASEAGFDFAQGQNQASVRWMQAGPSEAAARQAIADYDAELYRNLYQPLTPRMSYNPADPTQSVIDSGLWTYGTPAQIRDQLVSQWEVLQAEYIVLIFHYAQQPAKSVIENMAMFMEQIKPALDPLTPYSPEA